MPDQSNLFALIAALKGHDLINRLDPNEQGPVEDRRNEVPPNMTPEQLQNLRSLYLFQRQFNPPIAMPDTGIGLSNDAGFWDIPIKK